MEDKRSGMEGELEETCSDEKGESEEDRREKERDNER